VEDLTELFTAEFKRISGEKLHLDWFVSAVFEAQEIAQFTEAYRFLLLKRLSFTFEAAVRDLRRLRDLIERAPCFTEVTYRIDYFNKALSSSAVLVLPIPESNWNYETPEILRSNDPEVTEMLSEQFLTLRHEQEEAQIMALMSAHDVETALALVSPSDTQEVDTTLKARGEGGVVTIRFIKKDVKRLDWEKRKHQWTLVGFCSLTLGVYAHAYRHGYIKYLIFPAQRELAGSRQQGNSRQG
jgi:hypothetical protein